MRQVLFFFLLFLATVAPGVWAKDCQYTIPLTTFASGAHVERWRVQRLGGLTGNTIRIDGLSATLTGADPPRRLLGQPGGARLCGWRRGGSPERPCYNYSLDLYFTYRLRIVLTVDEQYTGPDGLELIEWEWPMGTVNLAPDH